MNARERLDAAFQELEELGYETHANFWCCSTCALAELAEETTKYVFWHSQDDVFAFGEAPERLRYDKKRGTKKSWEDYTELLRPLHLRWQGNGPEIMTVLRRHGFHLVGNYLYDPDKVLEIMTD